MADESLKAFADKVGNLIPKIMKTFQFTGLKEMFNLSLDLTVPQHYTLLALMHEDGRIMSSLSKEMSLSLGTMTGIIDRLKAKGYVRRERNGADRRIVRIWLTAKGRELIECLWQKREEYISSVLEKLSGEDREDLVRLLERVHKVITEFIEEREREENLDLSALKG